ncbi:MAG: hypothetical protein WDM77_07145 [Steroidobacteraceae bacterium]
MSARQISVAGGNAAHGDLLQRVGELRHQLTGWEACYVALAESLDLPLTTLDEQLARSKGVDCEFLTPGNS